MVRDITYTLEEIEQALNLAGFDAWSAQMKMTPESRQNHRQPDKPGSARLGGVLVLLYRNEEELQVVLTRRRDDLKSHAGQMSFPGGKREDEETLEMTALRETEEEIGVPTQSVKLIGRLTPLYIPPSDFEVHPFVAWYNNGSRPNFSPNPDEVAEIVEVPLRHLFDPDSRREQPWNFQGHSILVPYFAVGEHKVWGATAMMLSEFIERLVAVRPPIATK